MKASLLRGARRAGAFAALLGFVACWVRPRLLRNYTPSVPLGVYWLRGSCELRRGDLVVTPVPERAQELFAARHYAPFGINRLLKPLAALAGDRVCITGGRLVINGRDFGGVREADSQGLPLPQAPICRALVGSEGYLATDDGQSFDSRHFGPVELSALRGPFVPAVTW